MVSLLHGFSQMGKSIAESAKDLGLLEQKKQLEQEQALFSNQLALNREQIGRKEAFVYDRSLLNTRTDATAPTSREVKHGEEIITQEFRGGKWEDVSTAPREIENDNVLEEVYDADSPTLTRMVPRSEARNQPGKPASSAMSITGYDDAGRPLMQVGGRSAPGGMTPKNIADTNEKKLNAVEQLARINGITKSFKPEYLTFGNRWSASVTDFKDKAGWKPDKETATFLEDYTDFRRQAIANINTTIKEVTGAAMGVEEAQRIMAQLPDPGLGMFDGDGPTVFKSKVDKITGDIRRSLIRYNYATSLGKNPLETGIELADVDALYDKRGDDIERIMKRDNAGLSQETIDLMTRDQLKKEFGV